MESLRIRPRWLLAAMLLASVSAFPAYAQTLEVAAIGRYSVAADPGLHVSGPAASLALTDLRSGDRTADLRFGVARFPGEAWNALVEARFARSATLGLLGAASVELAGALRTDGFARAELTGQGVLGPASLRVGVRATGADPEAFAMAGVAPRAGEPRVGGPAVGAYARVRYRVSRDLLVDAEPDVVVAPAGLGVRVRGAVRLRRLIEPFDGTLAVHAWRAPDTGAVSGAIGLGAVLVPRRAPEWHGTVWIGWRDGAVRPGIAVQGAATLADGVGVRIDLAAEPFRADVPPYRGFVELAMDVGPHQAFATLEAQAGHSRDVGMAGAFGMRFTSLGR